MAGFTISQEGLLRDDALALQGAQCTGADLDADFFTVNHQSLLLKIRLPDFLGMALREADIIAELLAFAADFTCFHSSVYSTTFHPLKQEVRIRLLLRR